jgi:hypothetical protein
MNHSDADPDPACHFDTDPDPASDPDTTFLVVADSVLDPHPSFLIQIMVQNLEKVLKYVLYARIPYILACHLQTDADPDSTFQFDLDPDSQHCFSWAP